jgi:hypothetical protein
VTATATLDILLQVNGKDFATTVTALGTHTLSAVF